MSCPEWEGQRHAHGLPHGRSTKCRTVSRQAVLYQKHRVSLMSNTGESPREQWRRTSMGTILISAHLPFLKQPQVPGYGAPKTNHMWDNPLLTSPPTSVRPWGIAKTACDWQRETRSFHYEALELGSRNQPERSSQRPKKRRTSALLRELGKGSEGIWGRTGLQFCCVERKWEEPPWAQPLTPSRI